MGQKNKKNKKNYDVIIDNIVVSKLIEIITYYEYLIEYLNEVIRPLVLILPKLSRYVKTFKVKDGVKDKSNKLMSFRMDDDKLLEKYKIICTKVEDLQNNRLNDLPIYDDRYLKTKIRT